MKAAVLTAPRTIELVDAEVPPVGPGQARLANRHVPPSPLVAAEDSPSKVGCPTRLRALDSYHAFPLTPARA